MNITLAGKEEIMIIVNQDETEIVNFNNIIGINIRYPLEENEGKFVIMAETDEMEYVLGKYKTEKRAKEVFEMIIKVLTYVEMKIFKIPEN